MVKKIVGYDDSGKKIFEREARAYDQGIANKTFGITVADVFKVVPILVLIVTVYVNQQNFNAKMLESTSENSQAIGGIKETLANLNNYLSATTGKQFKDGIPRLNNINKFNQEV